MVFCGFLVIYSAALKLLENEKQREYHMWKVVLVFAIFFVGIAWFAFVENQSDKKKEKLENSSVHKIVIGIAVLIGIMFVIGTLTEAFG